MRDVKHLLRRFARDTQGTTAIEYGLIAMLIAIGALGGMQALGGGVSGGWSNVASKAADAMK
jgi:pilus assembly protein Flp/PilA